MNIFENESSANVNLQFVLSVTGLSEKMVTFMGTQRSPHNGMTTWSIIMSCDMDLEEGASTITVLPGEIGTFFVSFPDTNGSCLARSVTLCCNLTVPTLSGNYESFHRHVLAMTSRNHLHSAGDSKV